MRAMTHNLDQKRYIDAEGCVARRSPRTGRVSITCRVNANRYVAEKDITVVSQEQAVIRQQDRLCLRFQAAHARVCDRIEQSGGEWSS